MCGSSRVSKPGCCVDKACTSETCMILPEGMRCGYCVHAQRCSQIYGQSMDSARCQWFPRKFFSVMSAIRDLQAQLAQVTAERDRLAGAAHETTR